VYPQPATQLYPFTLPGQFIGVWASFDPTAGTFTYDVGPGYALGTLWFPSLTDAVQVYIGDSSSGSPFYTTGSGGSEAVPLPSGTTAVSLLSVDGTGAAMALYLTSLSFDPIKTTPDTASVVSVTATAPISSSGGANPNIALATPLAVAYGGTGTAAPSLVAGSGIAVSGTWPNQTVATTGASGVTSVSATAPLSSSGGNTPTIALTGIVQVASGGTGTASPAIVAGDGVSVTGTWPDQTVALSRNIFGGNAVTGTGGEATITLPYQITGGSATVAQNAGGTASYVMCVDNTNSNFPYGIIVFYCLNVSTSPATPVGAGVGFYYTIGTSNVAAL